MSLEHDHDLPSTQHGSLHDDSALKSAPDKETTFNTHNAPSSSRIYRRHRTANTNFTARVGTFIVALAAACLVFLVKRYDLEEVFVRLLGTGEYLEAYRTGAPSSTGHLSREYAICTRTKRGIYTLEERGNDLEWAERTQCIAVDSYGFIAATGSIGTACIVF